MLGEEGHRVQSEDSREGHLLFESHHSMGTGVFMVGEGGRKRERERVMMKAEDRAYLESFQRRLFTGGRA